MTDTLLIYIKAFVVGGLLCAVGQLLIDKTRLTPARILSLYVVAGVVLGGLGLYGPLVEWAGAGASVPLTGFGNVLAKGVKAAVQEEGFLGIFTGGFTAAAAGIGAAVFLGLAVAVVFKSKDKSG
ncbi:MAG: stage V sporulation protein AE [Oscillospiraceae bacterium]|jgi:stage V sporulation protein AE|nr:stage V sporulation protein AE [Oscillospiraceae bacterium]